MRHISLKIDIDPCSLRDMTVNSIKRILFGAHSVLVTEGKSIVSLFIIRLLTDIYRPKFHLIQDINTENSVSF